MGERSTVGVCGEAELIDAARAAVLEQSKQDTIELAPYLAAIELMEGIVPSGPCDKRILLAVDICEGIGFADRPGLCVRALRAALPPGSQVSDPRLERRWYTNVGAGELHTGNVASAVKHLAMAYEMANRQQDHLGLAGTWIPLSALASGAGQYEDAIRYAELVLKHFELAGGELSGGYYPRLPIAAYFNRGNANFRLGRLEDASSDIARVAALCGDRSDPWCLAAHVASLCSLAEVWLVRGEVNLAGTLLDNAKALHADEHGVSTAALNTERVRGQLLVWRGEFSAGLTLLESVRREAESAFGGAAYDGEAMDTLYALERSYRKAGDTQLANHNLTLIGAHLRAVAERAFVVAAEIATFPFDRSVSDALQELEAFIDNRERAGARVSSSLEAVATSLQHLVALTSSACAVEEPSGEHGLRVARLCREVSNAMGVEDEVARIAELAGLVHDAGKAGVPASTLAKREALTDHEERLLSDHSNYGADLIERTSIPGRFRVAEAVRLHHHPFDGVAAMRPLRGDAIPLEARLLAACDRFDALITGRPRQPALSTREALLRIFRLAGRDLDPRVVEVLIDVVRRLERNHGDLLAYLAEDAVKYDYTSARRMFRRAVAEV